MTNCTDRSQWPWNSSPADVSDYDAATWWAIKSIGDGSLPRQTLDEWVAEQRASRHRDRLAPLPMSDADHARLLFDLRMAWSADVQLAAA